MSLRRGASRKFRGWKTGTQKLLLVRSGPLIPKLMKVTGITKTRYGLPLEGFCAQSLQTLQKYHTNRKKKTNQKQNSAICGVIRWKCCLYFILCVQSFYSQAFPLPILVLQQFAFPHKDVLIRERRYLCRVQKLFSNLPNGECCISEVIEGF